MSIATAVRSALAGLVCVLSVFAALVHAPSAGSTTPAATKSVVAGTLSTRVVVKRFRAVGRKVVGLGTATSTFKDANGATSVRHKQFRLTIREWRAKQTHQGQTICNVLYLELGELDLTL